MGHTIRVFPRRTQGTPVDELVRIGGPTLWDRESPPKKVLVSVTFTWDLDLAEQLVGQWSMVCDNVKAGGPACDTAGDEFWPGMFLRRGYTITSRGCPNTCWFCDAWRREGQSIRELPIMPGYNVADNNLLACSDGHILRVFKMLEEQKERPHFTGGLEAALLRDWHVMWLARLKPRVMWFAYDTADDYEPLVAAAKMLRDAELMGGKHRLCCYVLAGWNETGARRDTIEEAEKRVLQVVDLGYFPQVMLMNDGRDWDDAGRRRWKDWSGAWVDKKAVGARLRKRKREKL